MWLFNVLLGALALMIVYALIASRRRVKALRALAADMGWSFAPADDPSIAEDFAGLPLFQIGLSRMANDVMHGQVDGREVEVFGYRYLVGNYKRRIAHHQTVVHVVEPSLDLPPFSLRSADAVRQMFGTQGFGNVFLEQAPEFSMRNYINAADPTPTAVRFTAPVLATVEAQYPIGIDAAGPHLFHFTFDRVVKVAEIRDRIREAMDLVDAFAARPPTSTPPPLT